MEINKRIRFRIYDDWKESKTIICEIANFTDPDKVTYLELKTTDNRPDIIIEGKTVDQLIKLLSGGDKA